MSPSPSPVEAGRLDSASRTESVRAPSGGRQPFGVRQPNGSQDLVRKRTSVLLLALAFAAIECHHSNDVTAPRPSTIDVLTSDGVTHHLDTSNFCLVGYQFQSSTICNSSVLLSNVNGCVPAQLDQSQMQSVTMGGSSLTCCKVLFENVVWHVTLKAGGQFVGSSCGTPSLRGRDVNTGMTTVIDYEQITRIVFP